MRLLRASPLRCRAAGGRCRPQCRARSAPGAERQGAVVRCKKESFAAREFPECKCPEPHSKHPEEGAPPGAIAALVIPQPDPLHLPPRRAHQRDPLRPRPLGDLQSRGQVHRWRPTPRRPRPPPLKSWASSGTCSAPWTATATTTRRTTGATRSPRTDPTRSSPATPPRPTVGPTAARPRTRCAGLPNLLCSSRLAAHSLGPRAPKATSMMMPPRSGASVRRAEQTVGGAAHNLPTKGCRALRRRRLSATPAGPPGTILWGQHRKASTRLVPVR